MTSAAWALSGLLLQSRSITTRLVDGAAEVLGLALLAGGLAGGVALLYRWYARERVPRGLASLVGLSGVALYLNSTRALGQVIGNTGEPLDETVALFNIVTVLVSLGAARAGTDVGDRAGTDLFESTADRVDGEVSRVVQAVGRVITVELPEDIEDIVGYDPVPDETKTQLAGKSFVFPRRLTVTELRDRLVTRLKADYAVGHVDIDLAADGTVEYLALGSRAAGIGPTLPPETSAVAVRADPAFAASAGDLVQVWETSPPERVLTAELRGTASDVVTLAVDAADTRKLDDDTEYKLVTLPVEARPDREFASLLRAADETMAAVTVAEGSPLVGQPTGALDVTVVAVRPGDGPVEPLPQRDRPLAAGDTLYLVATPEAIRRVDTAVRAEATVTAADPPATGSEMPPDRRVDATTPVAGDTESRGQVAGMAEASSVSSSGDAGLADEGSGQTGSESGEVDVADEPRESDRTVEDPFDENTPGIEALEDGEPGDDDASTTGSETGDQADGRGVDGGRAADDGADGDGDTSGEDDHGSDDGGTDDGTDDGRIDGAVDDPGDDDSPTGDTDEFDLGDPDLASLDGEGETGEQTAEDRASGEWTDVTSEGAEPADPTTEDLADLPGTDPDELAGTDVDELEESFDGDGGTDEDESTRANGE